MSVGAEPEEKIGLPRLQSSGDLSLRKLQEAVVLKKQGSENTSLPTKVTPSNTRHSADNMVSLGSLVKYSYPNAISTAELEARAPSLFVDLPEFLAAFSFTG